MLLYYIRHGDPIYRPNSLTELGKRQAEALAKRLALYGLDRIYSSPSTRAMQTAEPTSVLTKKDIVELDWCAEGYALQELGILVDGNRHFLFQDIETKLLLASNEMAQLGHRWWSHPAFAEYDFQKGMERIQRHTYELLEELGYRFDETTGAYKVLRNNDERIALFAHQGFGIGFLSAVLNIPYPQLCAKTDLGHSLLTVIEFRNEGGMCIPQMLSLSNDSHLYREGLPTKYVNRIYF